MFVWFVLFACVFVVCLVVIVVVVVAAVVVGVVVVGYVCNLLLQECCKLQRCQLPKEFSPRFSCWVGIPQLCSARGRAWLSL